MTEDSPYDVALVAALGIIAKLEANPPMTRQAKLATVTYGVLDAIHAAIEQARAGGSMLPVPAANNAAGTVRCRPVPKLDVEHSAANGRKPSPALPPPR